VVWDAIKGEKTLAELAEPIDDGPGRCDTSIGNASDAWPCQQCWSIAHQDERINMASRADSANTVRTLWHGSTLTVFERLSILSFLKHGHAVEVYSYGHLDVPSGVQLRDANEILPESSVFSYSGGPAKGSFAAFSNLFRIKLLVEKGGIWADSDFLCLRPMHDLPDACVGRHQEDFLNGAFLKFPAQHPICRDIYERASGLGADIKLGQMSGLVTEAVIRGDTSCVVLPVPAMYPIPWNDTWLLVDPDQRDYCETATTSTYCVHWWNTAITLCMGMSKEALPPTGSFLHEHAKSVLPASDLQAWPMDVARPWIEKFRAEAAGNVDPRSPQVVDPFDFARLQHEVKALRGQLDEREAEISQLLASRSWKLTAPLRALDRLLSQTSRVQSSRLR
jgi:hypothetical protein